MSQQPKNKMGIIIPAIFAIAVFIVAATMMGPKKPATPVDAKAAAQAKMFYGLKHATPQEIYAAIPDAKQDQPLLVEFRSQFCLDCKKMTPVLDELLPKYPTIQTRFYDMMKDRTKFAQVFNTLKPSTVPVLIFVAPGGEIINVLYDFHPKEELTTALKTLQSAGAPTEAPKAAAPEKKGA